MLELLREPWALLPAYAPVMVKKILAATLDPDRAAAQAVSPARIAGQVARMQLHGPMMQHNTWGLSTTEFGRTFDKLVADDTIGAIVLDIHSPGGQVWGTSELADKIFAARGAKPIVAQVNSQMASAALWVGTAADKVYVTPGGEAGSLGVIMLHADYSKFLENEGIKVSIFSTPEAKKEGNPFEPLAASAIADIEAGNKAIYEQFAKAVARNRTTTTAQVKTDYGGGRMLLAKEALDAGMVDGIQTIDETLAKLTSKVEGRVARSRGLAVARLKLAAAG